jgi:hypothetical protein
MAEGAALSLGRWGALCLGQWVIVEGKS